MCLVGVVVYREVYRFPHTILLLYLLFFAAACLLFVHFFKCFSFLLQYICNLFINLLAHYKQT